MYLAIWKKKVLYQCQITDYTGKFQVIFFDMTNQVHRKWYMILFKGMGIKKRKKRRVRKIPPKGQRLLDQYCPAPALTAPIRFKMPYHQQVRLPPLPAAFADSVEFQALQAYPKAKGYLNYLFQFNSFTFWENLPYIMKQDQIFGPISATEVFKSEIIRYKWGIARYDLWIRLLKHIPELMEAAGIFWDHIPTASQYGQLVTQLGSINIQTYFLGLVQECLTLRLIDGKIIIWDGRFLESDCAKNENKRLQRLADREAGKYKHIGKYFGVGYIDSSFICAKHNLTLFYESFPANRNHNPLFRQTFQELGAQPFPRAKILIADAGAYSKASLRLVRAAGTVPLIYARKNCKLQVIQVAPRKYVNMAYVPAVMLPYLTQLLNDRTKIERNYSPARVVYNASRMNNRGLENAKMNIGKLKCVELLTALTAVKLHRLDLINTPTAFRELQSCPNTTALKSVGLSSTEMI